MAAVQGYYLVSFQPDFNTWLLSDSSRNESKSPADQDLLVTLQSGRYAGNSLYFLRQNVLTINRVMVESNGAAGLRAPLKGRAAIVNINFNAVSPLEESCGGVSFRVSEFNKWYDVKTIVKPFEMGVTPVYLDYAKRYEPYKMVISSQSTFAYDGYNISSDYVGQEWAPRVFMELDTAGALTNTFILV